MLAEDKLPAFVQSVNQTNLDRLRAGYVPNSIELSDIQSFLQSVEPILAGYEEDIQRLQKLKKLREETMRVVDNARALASPVWKLPREILLEVFAEYSHDAFRDLELEPTDSLISDIKRPICSTLTLTWVCSFWRQLLLYRPCFWSSLFISIPSLLRHPDQFDIFHQCIARSANEPVDLILVHADDTNTHNDHLPLIHAVYNTLLTNHSRWRRFTSLCTGTWRIWLAQNSERISTSGLDQFPKLKFLHWDSGEVPYMLFQSCPELAILHGKNMIMTRSDSRRFWPRFLSRLTELQISYVEDYSGLEFLCVMPMLKKLVSGYFNPVYTQSLLHGTYCSNISTLCLSIEAIESPEFWERVQFPLLNTLELGGPQFRPVNVEDLDIDEDEYLDQIEIFRRAIVNFSEILLNAGAVLRAVKLYGMPGQEALAFLAFHPSISELTLSLLHDDNEDILIGLDISQNAIVPKLRFLSISFSTYDSDNDQIICDNLCRLVEGRTSASICSAEGVVKLENLALETEFRKSHTGQEVCRCLSGRIALMDKEYKEFLFEVSFDIRYIS